MTVAERRERNGSRDQFPIGMRILAVDDDPTCLKVLESLLVRCKYHVTTANQAVKALEMLRENTDQFDLVISDVHMPDMDGFKLLELVGLEMDLPVIMLSANGETQAVMKGITHGACDYLLKPVRIEELKNIWQHVIRRKKFDGSDQNSSDNGEDRDKNPHANSEGAQNSLANSSSDRNMKLNRKRKDQNEEDEDDDDDDDDNLHENEDPSAQKKPRVVWSVELHRKFVAAVNHLGIDKAVPKRILDLMNVEGLTRENVASHLQKYRLYLKRLSAVANQQANMVAALRGRDPSYLPMGSLDSYTNFIGSRPLANCTSFQPNGSVPRMNTFTGFGLHGFVPPSTSQLGHILNNTTNPINNLTKLQGNQQGTLIQPKAIQDASKTLFSGFSSPVKSFTNVTKIPQMLQSNQSSLRAVPLSSDPFDLGSCNETWQGAVLSSTYTGSTMSLPFNRNDVSSSSNIRNNISPIVSQNQASPLLTTTSANGDANLYNFRSLDNSNLKWEDPGQVHAQNPKFSYNSASIPSVSNIHVTDQTARDQKLGMDMPIMNQTSFGAPLIAQDSRSDNVSVGGRLNYKDEPLFEDMKLIPGGFSSGGFGLDDLVSNAMIKPECDDFTFIDGDMGSATILPSLMEIWGAMTSICLAHACETLMYCFK